MAGIELTVGWLALLLPALGAFGGLWLLWLPRKHLLRTVLIALGVGAVVGIGLKVLIDDVLNPWGAALDWRIYLYLGLGATALVLVVPRLLSAKRWWSRALVPLALVLVVAALAGQINQIFGYYPTLGSVWGDNGVHVETRPVIPSEQAGQLTAQTPTVTLKDWKPPAGMPSTGKVVKVSIPGPVSGMASGDSYIYIPPAYQVDRPANVPVLVLIHGNPGSAGDWIQSGKLAQEMDAYAAGHQGIAPLVVMPDVSGNSAAQWPLCMDSALGKGKTFLAVDVPNYVRQTFKLGLGSSKQFAIAGFSYGGTCALQLGVTAPDAFPIFLDISGERGPYLQGGDAALVAKYFGGDAAAFARVDPLAILKTTRFTQSTAMVVVGGTDSTYRPQGEEVYAALKNAGVQVQLKVLPGGHSWNVWRPGLTNNMDWLMSAYGVL